MLDLDWEISSLNFNNTQIDLFTSGFCTKGFNTEKVLLILSDF